MTASLVLQESPDSTASPWLQTALLGLCPLLAASNRLLDALVLGLASAAVLLISNTLVSALRGTLHPATRLLVFALIIGSAASVADRLLGAHLYEVYRSLGLWVPLIAANCLIFARAELCASRCSVVTAMGDALRTGLMFIVLLAAMGAVREVIGSGTLLAGAGTLTLELGDGLVLAALPPGAFLIAGLLLAALNAGARK